MGSSFASEVNTSYQEDDRKHSVSTMDTPQSELQEVILTLEAKTMNFGKYKNQKGILFP